MDTMVGLKVSFAQRFHCIKVLGAEVVSFILSLENFYFKKKRLTCPS